MNTFYTLMSQNAVKSHKMKKNAEKCKNRPKHAERITKAHCPRFHTVARLPPLGATP